MIQHKKTTGYRAVGPLGKDHQFDYQEFTTKKTWHFSVTYEGYTIQVNAWLIFEHGRYIAVDQDTGLDMLFTTTKYRSEAALLQLETDPVYLSAVGRAMIGSAYYKTYKQRLHEYLEELHGEHHAEE